MRSVLEKLEIHNDSFIKMFLFSMIFISCMINSEAAQNNVNQYRKNSNFEQSKSKKEKWTPVDKNFDTIPLKLDSAFKSLTETSEQISSNISSQAVKAELRDLSHFLKTFKGVDQLIPTQNTSENKHKTDKMHFDFNKSMSNLPNTTKFRHIKNNMIEFANYVLKGIKKRISSNSSNATLLDDIDAISFGPNFDEYFHNRYEFIF